MVYLGIDLGTSSVKVLAINHLNEIIGEASKEYPIYFPKEKWAQQNPRDWWIQTVKAIKELVENYNIPKDSVKSIGFSGQMHGLVTMDEQNNVLLPAILWCDNRTEEECAQITEFFGQERLREETANQCLTGFTAPKMLWVKNNHPDLYKKIAHVLLPKDYVRLCLTDQYATDYSDASGMLLLDVKNKKWSKEMCDYLEIDEKVLPELFESYAITGKVSETALQELGLTGEILVVGGAGDQAAGAIGTGTVSEGIVSVTLGTSGVVFAAHEEFRVDDDCRLHSFCHANGKYHSMGVMLSAANCLKWWVEQVNGGMDTGSLLEEAKLVDSSKSRVVFLPYLMGERTPYSDPNAKGTFVGMDMQTTRGHMTMAVLEGVAFGLKDSLEILKDLHIPIEEVRLIGGGARSELWRQIIADVFDAPIQEINTNQGGALGAAILAAVGAGAFESVEQGCQAMVKVVNTIKPNPINVEKYRKIYPGYRELYNSLKKWFYNFNGI